MFSFFMGGAISEEPHPDLIGSGTADMATLIILPPYQLFTAFARRKYTLQNTG